MPFLGTAFENEMIASSGFEKAVEQGMKNLCESPCQQLYRDVSMVKKWLANKDGKLFMVLVMDIGGRVPSSYMVRVVWS